MQINDQHISNRIINHHPNGLSAAIQMDDQPLSNRIINHQPYALSAAIQMNDHPLSNRIINHHQKGLLAVIQIDDQPLCKLMINVHPTGLSATIKWIIDLYRNGISTAIIMVYQWLSKEFISHNPSGLLTIYQADHQHLFKLIISHHQVDNRPLSKCFMNGYPNGLSIAIQIVYQTQSKWIINYLPSGSSTSIQVDYQPPSIG